MKDRKLSKIFKVEKEREAAEIDSIDSSFGYERFESGAPRLGWLVNMSPITLVDPDDKLKKSAVDYYFLQQDGATFKATRFFEPYFYVGAKSGSEEDALGYLHRQYDSLNLIYRMDIVDFNDLNMPNHVPGNMAKHIKIRFRTVDDLMKLKKEILPMIRQNREKMKENAAQGLDVLDSGSIQQSGSVIAQQRRVVKEGLQTIIDVREYDVPYYVRAAIDLDIRVGTWFEVSIGEGGAVLTRRPDLVEPAEPRVVAFDIECTKSPLKFPDSAVDQVFMISYMVDGYGYLLVNREVVSEDVEDFEYSPKPEYPGPFKVVNLKDEAALIGYWIDDMKRIRPSIYATFNGDFFDWPFMEARAEACGRSLPNELFIRKNLQDEYACHFASHMDCFKWVQRDSYLPQGSQGLKAVTKAKLGYDPVEIDPENMVAYAQDRPQQMAAYSVSDAVATYYLYMKYVSPFIFSLCTIIPMKPDDVLRKGSGTLCETLLMVEAYRSKVIAPNKHKENPARLYRGHLLDSGHVESLESGVFRADLKYRFKLEPSVFDNLMDQLDSTLKFAIETEIGWKLEDVTNIDEIKDMIIDSLTQLKETPNRNEHPMIYHVDVSAMYPNIILTNRLQPPSMVQTSDCVMCSYNDEPSCKRDMEWTWRGEYFPPARNEVIAMRNQLEEERFPGRNPDDPKRMYRDLTDEEKAKELKNRLKTFSQTVHRKVHERVSEPRTATVCQRENPFYVDAVRNFRDTRYKHKRSVKDWKKKLGQALDHGTAAEIQRAKAMVTYYDSQQLAHKCILNSFYGYVMRKASRWYSMEMAGVVTQTGASIIKLAKDLCDKIGRPLELDTDGIWVAIPQTFPENINVINTNGESVAFNYICAHLNYLVDQEYANEQYQDSGGSGVWIKKRENSIEFEVDGPYLAMVMPASEHEGKRLKKRYAVFNHDGTIAELKGFELKRRGELKLIKIFQSEVFAHFLSGTTLQECYDSVGAVANRWLNVLLTHGETMSDEELLDLITENKNLSRELSDYGGQKGVAQTAANRIAEFLGDAMVKGTGLACNLVISKKPEGAPVSERAVPVLIFQAEEPTMKVYLRKWLKDNQLASYDIRDILDWDYYIKRLGTAIQKIVSIPAAMQGQTNPVPKIAHPEWMQQKIKDHLESHLQKKMESFVVNMEDVVAAKGRSSHVLESKLGENSRREMERRFEESKSVVAPIEREAVVTLDTLSPDPPCSPDENFQEWWNYTKLKLRLERESRENLLNNITRNVGRSAVMQKPTATATGPQPTRNSNIASYAQVEHSFTKYPWFILQIGPEPSSPGIYPMIICVEGRSVTVNLEIPRIFYVNSRTVSPQDYKCIPVKAKLPRSRPVHHLYEYTISEEEYRNTEKEISSFFVHPDVGGVYETKVPLLWRALMKLGCTCQVEKPAQSKKLNDTFKLIELSLISQAQLSYLKGVELRHGFLYHCEADLKPFGRGLVAWFDLTLCTCKVILVANKLRRDAIPDIQRIYKDVKELFDAGLSEEERQEDREIGTPTHMDFENVAITENFEKAFHTIGVAISKFALNDASGVIVTQSPLGHNLRTHIPVLRSVPTVLQPYNEVDGHFPPIGWPAQASRKALTHSVSCSIWLSDLVAFSRWSMAPIGNVEPDNTLFSWDLSFSRRLKKAGHLSWMSSHRRPDIGGTETDDNIQDDLINPEIVAPGFYHSGCVEIEIKALPFASVLASAFSGDTQGGRTTTLSLTGTGDTHVDLVGMLDESSKVADPFNELRGLVKTWREDAEDRRSDLADTNLLHFYRWLRSHQSHMYEPALERVVHHQMKLLFLQLVGELRRLGTTVVYASFSKIIISTGRKTPAETETFVSYLLDNLEGNDLFVLVSRGAIVKSYWKSLLFMDLHNYGGMLCTPKDQVDLEEVPVYGARAQIEHNWNIASFLPRIVEEKFLLIIGDWIRQYDDLKKNDLLSENQIFDNITQKMLRLTAAIKQAPSLAGAVVQEGQSNVFPLQAGSHMSLRNPALEFVKFTTHLLSLGGAEDRVSVLKSSLMRQVGVREFSPESIFRNPCLSYVLPDIICKYCSLCIDLDLTRDTRILRGDWTCRGCGRSFEKDSIEAALVAIVERKSASFQLQDLVCGKDGQVKNTRLNDLCGCSGSFKNSIPSKEFESTLRVFLRIAQHHQMPWLLETVEWMLAAL